MKKKLICLDTQKSIFNFFLFVYLQQKLIIYESYVKDLSIQTRLLLQSLEELEKEANQRVALLENKLKKAHATLEVYYQSFSFTFLLFFSLLASSFII